MYVVFIVSYLCAQSRPYLGKNATSNARFVKYHDTEKKMAAKIAIAKIRSQAIFFLLSRILQSNLA